MASPKYPHSNLQNVPANWQTDFAEGIKMKMLRWENHPRLPGWIHCNCKGPHLREEEGSETDWGVTTKVEVSRSVQ